MHAKLLICRTVEATTFFQFSLINERGEAVKPHAMIFRIELLLRMAPLKCLVTTQPLSSIRHSENVRHLTYTT